MQKFKVYWKGEFVGEFTLEELRSEVARAAIGSLHSVLLNSGKFISVGDLLQKLGDEKNEEVDFSIEQESAKEEVSDFEFTWFGYALAGLSFLSISTAIAAVIYCIFLAKASKNGLATQILFLSILIGAMGFFFKYFLEAI